ncbi:unnamed protein product [Ambrosiozyma monospora]|uniref:Unnamed protein product n=1 Tax=Ambrosiozyma monospora TaxID=43982 RepID=A0ACB5TUE9_AMBMO|nr:unnamed protein product [Ambrosiozyma monospora]
MKLRLWAILFDHYDANKVSDSYQYGFEAIVSLMVHDLQSSDFNNLSGSKKTHGILKFLGFFELFAEKFCTFFSKCDWSLPHSEGAQRCLENLLYLFNFIYTFLVVQDYAHIDNSKTPLKETAPRAYGKLVDLTLLTFTLISVYYDLSLSDAKPETINDFVSILHGQLGVRKICNNRHGYFLDFVETKLSQLKWTESDNDFFQSLHCRYETSIVEYP